MSSSLESFPELRSTPPVLMGETPLPATALTALRRQQLTDLARAFEIEIPDNATKKEMLYPLQAAEQQGVFKTQPKHPWYLLRANRNPDDPYVPLPPNPDDPVAAPEPVSEPAPVKRMLPKRAEGSYRRRQRLLKAKGVKGAYGITAQAMQEMAEEHGIE